MTTEQAGTAGGGVTYTDGGQAVQDPAHVAARFGLSVEWARLHIGDHRCVDGRRYVYSCLVTDPSCDHLARSRMATGGSR